MAGHNKWSKVKHIKGVVDVKRGKLFSKLSHEISIATKEGGKDPDLNPRLRQAISAAKAQNMPNDNVQRAIKKGAGEIEGVSYEEITYEGYGPGGVAMIVETATDNKNRTAADMRRLFSRSNGNLGSSGSVAYMFDRRGEIRIPLEEATEEKMLEVALEVGADDNSVEDEEHVLLTAHESLAAVASSIGETRLTISSQKLIYVPQTLNDVTEPSTAAQVLKLYDNLDDHDDTINVYANFDISDEVIEAINAINA